MSVLGIDVGGTKTVCLLGDDEGRILARSRGPGANLQAVGELQFEKVLHSTMESAVANRPSPTTICLGIAGVDRAEDSALVHSIMSRVGYKARILVVNDALIALQAGIGDAPGIVVVAGTGSIAYGRNARGVASRAGGWGHVLGDEGSGYWIGRQALQAVMRESDGRGEATVLTRMVLEHYNVQSAEALVPIVYQQELKPSEIAALAQYVQTAFDTGDRIAAAILERSAAELTAAAAAVTRRLRMSGDAFSFVLAGGMFHAVGWLREKLARTLPDVAPCSRTVHLQDEPAIGAVQLALAAARGTLQLPQYGV